MIVKINGRLRLSDETGQRTMRRFGEWVKTNTVVLQRYFGGNLFEGSLNVDVQDRPSIQQDLDAGIPRPTFVIPVEEIDNGVARHLGDGQAWACELKGKGLPEPIRCWIFRRKNSGVDVGVIELVAHQGLVDTHRLRNGDEVVIDVLTTQPDV
jgi:CTP-dependent riboflavin kinase